MNPLTLPGPQFLLFYVATAALVLVTLFRLVRHEPTAPPPALLSDPYAIALLRVGPEEAIRVGLMVLIDRGVLRAQGQRLSRVPGAAEPSGKPLERSLWRSLQEPAELAQVLARPGIRGTLRELSDELVRRGLLPEPAALARRRYLIAGAAAGLVLLAGAKIAYALGHGHRNVEWLVVACVFAVIGAVVTGSPRHTGRGVRALAALTARHQELRARAPLLPSGTGAPEVAMLGAVFGLAAVPANVFPQRAELFPRAADSGSGSSCSSGCGSGCGGGCGGCS